VAIIASQTTPTNFGDCGYAIKQLLVTAGWSVLESGTGSAGAGSGVYNATGDAITTGALMNNTNAWFRIRSPLGASGPQFVFQNANNGGGYNIWFTCYGVSSAGNASTPTTLLNGSQIRQSSWTLFASTTSPVHRLFVAADNAAPYGFWFGQIPVGGGAVKGINVLAPLSVTNPGDVTPYMVVSGLSSSSMLVADLASYASAYSGHLNFGYIPGTTNCTIIPGFLPTNQSYFGGALNLASSTSYAGGYGADPITGKDALFPIMYARSLALTLPCWKGVTSFFRLKGTIRGNADTATVATPSDYIHMGDVVLPWDGSVPVL
jgi:hypothetical protein